LTTNKLIIREFIQINDYYEIRCFVYRSKLRGISCSFITELLSSCFKEKITEYINKIIYYTEYDACSIDLLLLKTDLNDFTFLEINSPVWLFATSGLFDLQDKHDYELLLGDYDSDIFSYPEIKIPTKL
jgi:hypothetical protein